MIGRRLALAGGIALALSSWGCEEVEQYVDQRRPSTPHEAYLAGLHEAGLAGTALSQAWIMEAGEAVRSPLRVELPFREEGYIAPERPDAVGYRFRLERGQTLKVTLEVESESPARVFLDLLRVAEDPSEPPRPVAADTTPDGLLYEPYRDGEFLVRVQPELLAGGRFTVNLALDPALAFPVAGLSASAIQSVWGDPREGGRRSHEGVDIFAPRGTPVVASVDGRVSRANVTGLGGKVVWIRDDSRRRSLYYAHLDSQVVSRGDRVQVGDTLGFVGNTGNARTTPPHLHYGVYYRGQGAVDPAPFLRSYEQAAVTIRVDRSLYGEWVRIRDDGIRLRTGPSRQATIAAELELHTPARVLGGARDWYRVALPDGSQGYVAARLTEGLSALEPLVAAAETPARTSPWTGAPQVEVLPAGSRVDVTGRFGDFVQVLAPSGRLLWLPDPSPARPLAALADSDQQ
jgi:murein DD-endopeptidase MepM/ murein hydrolase activator NlpD